ncbi:NAD+ synthase [Mycoplasmopsis mustelae]|uniref:NH(3)-dependent NAD(+) synthetase n=1 Tax=Mycoplasmopsis mustelae TaxID=171289 RepID=A0A4R7UDE7_9BACT|nr:NAD(+) synthase [Mycoplasmopsis mustelae]TDV24449.1 NAD+ synthase [Mycoplasmopsis mustelae]
MSLITKYNGFSYSFDEQKAKKYIKTIQRFLANKLKQSNSNGFVVGISGGIDSALTYALAHSVAPKHTFGFVMPIQKMTQEDLKHIQQLESDFHTKFETINLTETFNTISKQLKLSNSLAIANIKPRLRMTTLYAKAQENNSLVLGTDNADEIYIGYFTKYGDGGADLLPICQLTKAEVGFLAKLLKVPDSIINKKPSAGLWDGQTDENELGFSYQELDFYLNHLNQPSEIKKYLSQGTIKKIQYKHKISQHKRDKIYKPNKVR